MSHEKVDRIGKKRRKENQRKIEIVEIKRKEMKKIVPVAAATVVVVVTALAVAAAVMVVAAAREMRMDPLQPVLLLVLPLLPPLQHFHTSGKAKM